MPSQELKPCKWCGEYPLHVVTTEHHRHIYECDNPHCQRFGLGIVVEEPTREAAVAAWNRRAEGGAK